MGEHSLSKLTNFDFYMKVDTNKKKIQKHKKEKIQTGTVLVLHAIYQKDSVS